MARDCWLISWAHMAGDLRVMVVWPAAKTSDVVLTRQHTLHIPRASLAGPSFIPSLFLLPRVCTLSCFLRFKMTFSCPTRESNNKSSYISQWSSGESPAPRDYGARDWLTVIRGRLHGCFPFPCEDLDIIMTIRSKDFLVTNLDRVKTTDLINAFKRRNVSV